jgi:hypothetical protein
MSQKNIRAGAGTPDSHKSHLFGGYINIVYLQLIPKFYFIYKPLSQSSNYQFPG